MMNFKKILLAIFILLSSITTQASDLSNALESPDYILLMRHTLAPGFGDPPNYTLTDCNSQRNLSLEGQSQAITIGNWLKKKGIKQALLYSSPWCRCKDTARLLDLGEFKIEFSLASFFDEMQKAKESTQALQSFISEQLKIKGNKALILVTHHVNIYEYMGENISPGDMVLAKVNSAGKMISYTTIPRPN